MTLLQYWSRLAPPPPAPDAAPASAVEIFHRHVPRLYSLARRMAGNEADAEDIVGDVLVAVLRKLDSFRGESELSTWLHRITVNTALGQRRRSARERRRDAHELLAALKDGARLCGTGASPEGPEQHLLAGEAREMVERAIAGLPEMHRDVYVLADVEQMPNADIGQILGLSLAAVKSRLHRARLSMRRALDAYF